MDEADIDVGQTGLPGDGAFGFAQCLALDVVDQPLELPFGDRLVRALALLAVRRREALDELSRDADDDLGRSESSHLLGFLERDCTVVDDGRDVGDRPRLHVREALTLSPHPSNRPVPGLVDLEDERLGELRPDVEGGARGEALVTVALPDPAPEGHQPAAASAARSAARASSRPARRVPLPWAISGRPPPLPPIAGIAARTRSPAAIPRAMRSSETVTNSWGSSLSRASAMTPLPRASRVSRARPLSASIESAAIGAMTDRMPGVASSARLASSAGRGRPAPPPAFRRRFVSRRSSCRAAIRSSIASTERAPTSAPIRSSVSRRSRIS